MKPWRVTDAPSDACCHDVGIEDADGKMIADVCDRENGPLVAAAPDMRNVLLAVLLFHTASPWDDAKAGDWLALTGFRDATTQTLCILVRAALVKSEGHP